jgi:hypothetical protein
MKPENERLIQASNDFLRLLLSFEVGPFLRRSRFYESCLRRGWPWRIVPRYTADYAIIQNFERTLRDSRLRTNRGKIVVFDSLIEHRFVSETDLDSIDTDKAISMLETLNAFRLIYRMEIALANAYVPYVELLDELDFVIEDFGIAPDNTLANRVREMRRKLRRRALQTQVSAILALMSFALITGGANLAGFLSILVILTIILFCAILPSMALAIWTSFVPLLSDS